MLVLDQSTGKQTNKFYRSMWNLWTFVTLGLVALKNRHLLGLICTRNHTPEVIPSAEKTLPPWDVQKVCSGLTFSNSILASALNFSFKLKIWDLKTVSGKNALALLPLFSAFLLFPDLLKLFILNLLASHAQTQPYDGSDRNGIWKPWTVFKINGSLFFQLWSKCWDRPAAGNSERFNWKINFSQLSGLMENFLHWEFLLSVEVMEEKQLVILLCSPRVKNIPRPLPLWLSWGKWPCWKDD